eukprot:CAMPEP_0172304168 /NCGR_PEP_ID=MMETSP1058-20130122/5614_1 /TAXON_ID=83371 /ORGANISM="Detonula confervacea, Strain CCMP 353" /LENGTH=66 /DNA_ID=CAMNT_0013015285 /DNA_START=136 /DNA_END=333 /DNA_ORIENTATION=+
MALHDTHKWRSHNYWSAESHKRSIGFSIQKRVFSLDEKRRENTMEQNSLACWRMGNNSLSKATVEK